VAREAEEEVRPSNEGEVRPSNEGEVRPSNEGEVRPSIAEGKLEDVDAFTTEHRASEATADEDPHSAAAASEPTPPEAPGSVQDAAGVEGGEQRQEVQPAFETQVPPGETLAAPDEVPETPEAEGQLDEQQGEQEKGGRRRSALRLGRAALRR